VKSHLNEKLGIQVIRRLWLTFAARPYNPRSHKLIYQLPVYQPDYELGALGDAGIMGHQDHRHAQLLVHPQQQLRDLHPRLAVQVAGWFVGQEQPGLVAQRSRNRHTLLLSA
jgi:hypothetical protein